MNNLSHYVKKTKKDGQVVLLNTVNKVILPTTATLNQFKENYFLKGQEKDCLTNSIFKKSKYLHFNIIPTWKCNLRCSHCCVLHRLKDEDEGILDLNLLKDFVQRYLQEYQVDTIAALYIGGEAFIEVKKCLEISNALKAYGIEFIEDVTTNLVYSLTSDHLEMFDRLTHIGVSLDGDEETHNEQRRPYYDKNLNPYRQTIDNLKILIEKGYADKIAVQAGVKDKYFTKDLFKDFHKELIDIGIPIDNIIFSGIHPTKLKPEMSKTFTEYCKSTNLNTIPCCKYRYMSNFTVNPDNTIYDNYYVQENSLLGTLRDDIKDIENKYKENIYKSMGILNDKNCLNCPVVGYCWGKCVNGYVAIGNKPSSVCDQQTLIEKVDTMAAAGKLPMQNSIPECSNN